MAKTQLIQGSWHNTGYHGHFRSKSRTDFLCEYRHLAKPSPPKKFLGRSTENPAKHSFSMHDNRNSFMNDALYFEQGLGRRRIRNNTNRYQKDLLMWGPDRVTFERGDPSMSVYKLDYPIIPGSDNVKQKVTQRPKTSFDDDRLSTTSYRYAHGEDNPNKSVISAMSNDGLKIGTSRRLRGSFISGRESVATCLNWYVPKTFCPAATQTFEPTPPKETSTSTEQKTDSSCAHTSPNTTVAPPPCAHSVPSTTEPSRAATSGCAHTTSEPTIA